MEAEKVDGLARAGMLVNILIAIGITVGGIDNYLKGTISVERLVIGIPVTILILFALYLILRALKPKRVNG